MARWSKEHILSEIRRTADANAGKPLGKQRFWAATGIKESDWIGRHWIRWRDALEEAGFGPNQLNQRFADERVLASLASLTRELGHFPVHAELRLKARSDPSFPSHNTFRRWGDKPLLAARLRAYCEERGFADVAALCEPLANGVSEAAAIPEREPLVVGFVYLIRFGSFFKIGRTNAAGRRERELAIQLPEKTTPVHTIKTDDPVGIEEYWHRRFHAKRRNGEWFDLTSDDVAAFRRRRFM